MMNRQRPKPLSRSSELENEQNDDILNERQQTKSNNGSHVRWAEPDIVIPKPTEMSPHQPIIEALRRPQLPTRFGNEVILSEEVSLVEEINGNRTNQGPNSQSSCRSKPIPQMMENKSDFHLLEEMKQEEASRPIYFNVMVVGGSGLGKSNFIDAFLHRKFQEGPVICEPTTEITYHYGQRDQGLLHFKICMVDTPGYKTGSHKDYYKVVKKEIVDKLVKHHESEVKLRERTSIVQGIDPGKDERIHCCLFFIGGPRISEQDAYIMSKLQKYVSIVPILARGDCYTNEQIEAIKEAVYIQKSTWRLQWFECEEVLRSQNPKKLTELLDGPFGKAPPFVMVSSFKRIKFQGQKTIYGRHYNWGICNIDNPAHSDFFLLYNLLINYFSKTLIQLTQINQQEYVREAIHIKNQPITSKHLKILGFYGLVAICAYGLVKKLFSQTH